MKTALNAAGEFVTAGANAPQEAICPVCRSKVILRKRRLMGGGYTYYWQHRSQWGFKCRQHRAGY